MIAIRKSSMLGPSGETSRRAMAVSARSVTTRFAEAAAGAAPDPVRVGVRVRERADAAAGALPPLGWWFAGVAA